MKICKIYSRHSLYTTDYFVVQVTFEMADLAILVSVKFSILPQKVYTHNSNNSPGD